MEEDALKRGRKRQEEDRFQAFCAGPLRLEIAEARPSITYPPSPLPLPVFGSRRIARGQRPQEGPSAGRAVRRAEEMEAELEKLWKEHKRTNIGACEQRRSPRVPVGRGRPAHCRRRW